MIRHRKTAVRKGLLFSKNGTKIPEMHCISGILLFISRIFLRKHSAL